MPHGTASPTAILPASPPITDNARCGLSSANASSAACCSRRSTGASHRDRRARRLAGGAVHRSVLRPAREQGDAGSIAPYEYVFRGFALSRTPLALPDACLVGARRRQWRLWLSARRQCRSQRDGNPGSARSRATISPNTRILAAASIARRPLPRTASKPACSSALRATPATGMWSRGCLRRIRSATIQRRMLLSGKSADGLANAGPIVCACFGVGRTTICRRDCSRRAFRRRDRRQAEGRHQLRLLHSGNEAADRADRAECRAAAIGCGGELGRPLSVIARSEATKQSIFL